MMFNAGCWKRRLAALAIATISLTGCATVSSEQAVGACPPVVEYDAVLQARAAEEVPALLEGSAVVEMLSDYAVMREQARACTST